MEAPSIWAAQDNAANLPDFQGGGSAALWNIPYHKWAADANRPIEPEEDGLVQFNAAYAGINARTWSTYNVFFGNLSHIVPNCEFID